ncbi:hypothetical protein H4S02_003748 [Coemansia sp. RSA 2611]|nr:hypothetical protein H4S01_006818 [Coemansia sp. RSA 2610]KAJ2386657.1 hypothetical protein H4S02_003748 [Coemansia sp. RSA 2611]
MEVLMIAAAVGLVANYFYGSRKNAELASVWERPIADVLQANFSTVGDGSRTLEWDSAADLLFYASGRRHCKYAQGHLMLTARQDPIALINDLTANNQEKLQIEVVLNDDVAGFVFAVVPRKRSKAVNRDRYDISTFAKVAANDKLPSGVVLFSENADATGQLLESGLDKVLASENCLLQEIFVSDSPAEKPESHEFKHIKRLLATIRVPGATEAGIKEFREVLEFVFYLVDYIGEAVRLRPESTKKLAKARDEAFKEFARMAEQEKQEALAKVLADKRRAELEEVEKMSPDQRRKWEEKDRKRQLKKEQNKRTRRVK